MICQVYSLVNANKMVLALMKNGFGEEMAWSYGHTMIMQIVLEVEGSGVGVKPICSSNGMIHILNMIAMSIHGKMMCGTQSNSNDFQI